MKKCLLIIGLVAVLGIGGCTALTVGSCAAGLGLAGLEMSNMPDYANTATLSDKYGDDFEKIHKAIKEKTSLKYSDKNVVLSDDILAVIVETNGSKEDIYARYHAKLGSHMTMNGAGTGTLEYNGRSEECILYQFDIEEREYTVCIRDTFKTEKSPAAETDSTVE